MATEITPDAGALRTPLNDTGDGGRG